MKIAIVTNDRFSDLGWGTEKKHVEDVAETMRASGATVTIHDVPNAQALYTQLEDLTQADLVWPNTYHFYNKNEKPVSLAKALEKQGIKILGPSANTLETTLSKERCQKTLSEQEVPTPRYLIVTRQDQDELSRSLKKGNLSLPVIVKPTSTSGSRGIDLDSVQDTLNGAIKTTQKIIQEYNCAIIEEFLPGLEFTVGVIGNGRYRRTYTVSCNTTNGHNVLDYETRHKGFVRGTVEAKPIDDKEIAHKITSLATKVCNALEINDFTRFDGRLDQDGNPKVFDVNGMPGLARGRSYSTNLFYVLFPEIPRDEIFNGLINSIIHAAATRHEIEVPDSITNNTLYLKKT